MTDGKLGDQSDSTAAADDQQPGGTPDASQIESFVNTLEAHQLTRLEFERGDFRVVLERQQNIPAIQNQLVPTANSAPSPSDIAVQETLPSSNGYIVKAPLVGTVYGSRNPQDAPFVSVGNKVTAGDILCLIEAMKCYNEITAPVDGVVTDILIADGELVEFNQPLFTIDQSPN